MDAKEFDRLATIEEKHWFFSGQWAIARQLLRAHLPSERPLMILDAGCGTGGTSKRLQAFGHVVAIDQSWRALAHAGHHDLSLCRGSITALPFADGSFDLVTSFDVLYHSDVVDDRRALEELRRVLKPRGFALVRVPALQWLRGAHDIAVHTRQRYSRNELRSKIQTAGLHPVCIRFANTLLLPAVLAKRALEGILPLRADLTLPREPLNALLGSLLSIEALLIERLSLPIGVSLWALAQRG